MHNQPTAVPGQREAGPVSPVIAGGVWLGDDDRDQPLVLQLQLPVSAEELAAALYDDDRLSPADLAADQNVWGFAAAAITRAGLNAIWRCADEIVLAEARGTLAHPTWLAICRRRVAGVTGTAPRNQDANSAVSGLATVRALNEITSPCHAEAQM